METRMNRQALVLLSVLAFSCGHKTPSGPPPESFCPGAAGCMSGSDGAFKAGIAAVKITPSGFEKPVPLYLSQSGDACPDQAPVASDGKRHCGKLLASAFHDCGTDTVCPGDNGYTAPDTDGSEGDGKPDWFYDCGRDQKCPGDTGYSGPDTDGSEGDGQFQGFWFGGFGNNIPMAGVLDDIEARAVVFINGDVQIAMVSVDTVGLFRDDIVKMRDLISQKAGAGTFDYVLISATHTHESVDTMGQFGPTPGLVPERGVDDAWFANVLMEGVAQSVVTALSQARPAKLAATQVKLGQQTNQVIRDMRDPFVSDDAVTVLELTQTDGTPIGSVVSWGNHPETLYSVNNFVSADYVGFLRRSMESGVFAPDGTLLTQGLGGTCVFFAGAVGGMMSSIHAETQELDGTRAPPSSVEKTRAVGDRVAKATLEGLMNAQPMPSPPLAFGAQTLKLPVDNALFQLLFANFDIIHRRACDFDKTKPITPTNTPYVLTEVAKIELGPLRFVAVPGELLPELAVGFDPYFAFGNPQIKADNPNPPDLSKAPPPPYLKSMAGGDMPCILGLANDELGYLVPAYDFKVDAEQPYVVQAQGDHYEETNSLGPRTVPMLMDAYANLFKWEPAD
jgi:hypothetical protein